MSDENKSSFEPESLWQDLDPEIDRTNDSLTREEQLKIWKTKKEKNKNSCVNSKKSKSISLKNKTLHVSLPEKNEPLQKVSKPEKFLDPETKKSRKLSTVGPTDSKNIKPGPNPVISDELLKSVRTEIESLQDSEKNLMIQSDQILKLHRQAAAKANAVSAKKNELLDRIGILLNSAAQTQIPLETTPRDSPHTQSKDVVLHSDNTQTTESILTVERIDSQTQTDFEFESELRKAAKCIAAYTMVNCANNIMHQKIMEQEGKLAEERESRSKQEEIYKEKISTLECENQLLEAELDKFRLQVVQLQEKIQKYQGVLSEPKSL